MRQLFYQLKSALKAAAGLGSRHLVRQLESRLAPQQFYALLQPVYFVRAALNVGFKKSRARLAPDFLRRSQTKRGHIRTRQQVYLNHTLEQFQDRLGAPRWLARCPIEVLEYLHAAQRASQPVILAFAHLGPFYLIHYWLRAAGFPVTGFVGGASTSRSRLNRFQDRRSAQPQVPVTLYQDQLRQVAHHLAAGNHLLIAIDIPTGRQMQVAFCDGWDLQMATGALRLASRYDAVVIPCSIIDEGQWCFRIRLSPPLPPADLDPEADYARAGKYLVDALLPVLRDHPQQCSPDLLRSLKPSVAQKMAAA